MSREVDPNAKNLSDDDKMYLAQRGLLPTDVMSAADQQKLLNLDNAGPSPLELANTGTAATMTTDELEAELERRRAQEVPEDKLKDLMTNPGGLAGAQAGGDDDALEAPYDQYNKAQLSAELARRNEERDEDDQLPLSGTKDELVERLDEDDEE